VDFANDFVKVGGYLVGLVPANVARDGKALANQPLALGFAPLNDLSTIHGRHAQHPSVVRGSVPQAESLSMALAKACL